jgi:hypothetical protein
MNPSAANHQSIIRMMGDSKPPPPDAETPEIPEELLKRLQEKYGSKVEPIIPMELPEKEHTEEPPKRIISRRPRFLTAPQWAIAASLLLLGTMATLWFQPQEELLRGPKESKAELPVYWLSQTIAAPQGLGLPKFIVTENPPSSKAILCDPTKATATLLDAQGKALTTLPITDPADPEEWLTAHRQLKQQTP